MLPDNPFLQLVPNRASAALKRLQGLIWTRLGEVAVEATTPQAEHISLSVARRLDRRVLRAGATWGRLYDQRWCRLAIRTPGSMASANLYIEWRDQAEATLYVDAVPYYGFDVAHRRCLLPKNAGIVWVESTCVQTGVWHPEATGLSSAGSLFTGAFLVQRDDDAWHAYHDLRCLADLASLEMPTGEVPRLFGLQPSVEKVTPFQRRLLRVMDRAIDAFDTRGSAAMRAELAAAMRDFRRSRPFMRALLTGHAHLDLVWLWPERIGEAKAVHTFATVNRLMAQYPEFRFAYSQPASYAAVARRAPALSEKVRERMKEGRWQATGALYVESDTLLPCGEALARSFVYGQEDFAALRGAPVSLLWLPDVFGYAGCVPQLMQLSGVKYFFTTKMTWSAINRFPYSSFVWRGTDGSEVVAHVTQDAGYNGAVQVGELTAAANAHAQSDIHDEFLCPTGYGDGGGGPTEEMCERARRLNALPGLPALRWGQPEEFFERLERIRSQLPVYQGECYLEYHRGTFTTHGHVKAAFRGLEKALQVREAVAVVTRTRPALGEVWRRMVFAQFHDAVPGSSIPDVYHEMVPELEGHARGQIAAAKVALEQGGAAACLFNPLPIPLRTVISGRLLALPPLAGVTLAGAVIKQFRPVRLAGRTLTNGIVEARINARGELATLAVDGEPVALDAGVGRLVTYVDRAANFEAWDIDRHTLALGVAAAAQPTISCVLLKDGLSATVRVRRLLGTASSAQVDYRLDAEAAVLRIKITLDWREPETLLKMLFPTSYRGGQARCGMPFGTVQRSQQAGDPRAEAMWEIPCSRHLTVTNDGGRRGLSVLTDSKYGFGCRDGTVSVSLVRSPRAAGLDGHSKAYPRGLSRLKTPSIYCDQGAHEIELALALFRADGPRECQPAALAESLFSRPLPYRGQPGSSAFQGLTGDNTLVPYWAVPAAGDAWVLRLHETGGESGSVQILHAEGWRLERVDLLGRKLGEEILDGMLVYRPHEIVSVRFVPSR